MKGRIQNADQPDKSDFNISLINKYNHQKEHREDGKHTVKRGYLNSFTYFQGHNIW